MDDPFNTLTSPTRPATQPKRSRVMLHLALRERRGQVFTRLRTRLLLLLLMALLPALLMMSYTAQQYSSMARENAKGEALRLANVVAGTQERLEENTKQLLIALANLPAVQTSQTEVCDALFATLLRQYDSYTNIFSVDLMGKTVCSSLPVDPSLNASTFPWFVKTRQDPAFHVSEYTLGQVSKRSVITLSYPVYDMAGSLHALLGIGLDLEWVSQVLREINLPEDTQIVALDGQGVILYQYPIVEGAIGSQFHDTALVQALQTQSAGTIEHQDAAGHERLYGFTYLGTQGSGTLILVGLSGSIAYEESNQLLAQNLAGLSLVGIVIVIIAWGGTDMLLMRPVNALVENARRLANGDVHARVNLSEVEDTYELKQLALVFNDMAHAQETRQRQLEHARENSEYKVKMKTRELQFLVEVSKTLASSLAYEVTLSKVATMTVRQIAHWCTFHVMEASGDPAKPTIRLVALAHREPEMQAWGQDLEQRYPFFSRFEPTLLKDQRPKLYKDRQQVDALFDLAALNAEHRALLAQSDVDSLIALPLLLRDNVSGILTLGFAKSSTGNNLQYLWLGQEIARLAAVSLENARLYREALVQEENLRSLNAELDLRVEQRTHQLQAVNKELEAFSHSVSHDLRTPLRAIDGFSQALIEDYATRLDDQGLSYLRRVREATRRMDHLIDDLLKLSRLTRSELDFAPVDLTRIAHEVIGELRAADTQRQANIVIQDGLVAYGDARLLYIALQNLLGNAWKFSAKRQLATIELGLTHVDGQQAYYVKDNGAGFEMAYASKLFGAFQRLHHAEDFEGNGIGLATVQRILHRHGGQVWAKGALDQGAVFYFTLPITRPNHRQN